MPIEDIVRLLRTSNKYDITNLRAHCVQSLKRHFPSTLSDFIVAYGSMRDLPDLSMIVDLVKVARESNTLELIPSAFYLVSLYGMEHIAISAFSQQDQQSCILGILHILKAQRRMGLIGSLLTYVPLTLSSCSTPVSCRSSRDGILQRIFEDGVDLTSCIFHKTASFSNNFCEPCRNLVISDCQRTREEAWQKLPGWFGLGDWESLKDSS